MIQKIDYVYLIYERKKLWENTAYNGEEHQFTEVDIDMKVILFTENNNRCQGEVNNKCIPFKNHSHIHVKPFVSNKLSIILNYMFKKKPLFIFLDTQNGKKL